MDFERTGTQDTSVYKNEELKAGEEHKVNHGDGLDEI